MIGFIIFIIIIFVIAIVTIILSVSSVSFPFSQNTSNIVKSPYFKKEYLLTKAEHEFFKILQLILKDKQYYIFPQIHLNSLLQVKPNERYQKTFFNKIDRKSVDFIICDSQYLKPLLAIELDDNSHYRYKRQVRDQFVNKVLESVGLKGLRIRTSYSYNFEELKSQILQGLL